MFSEAQDLKLGLAEAASSVSSGLNNYDLDFESVQRGNPEMQRRTQEVINFCAMSGEKENLIKSIHDVCGRFVKCHSRISP